MNEKSQAPILVTSTGGFGFSALMGVLLGVFLIVVQLFMLTNQANFSAENFRLSMLIPGFLGLVFIATFLISGMRKGEIKVFRDRIECKKKNGKFVTLAMNDFVAPDLFSGKFILKNSENQLLLLESPQERKAIGAIWLLKQYPDFPSEFWNAPFEAGDFVRSTRHFMGENGQPIFCDNGFLLDLDKETFYFPISPAVKMIGDQGPRERIYERPDANFELPIQFEPEPARLPMPWLCHNILNTSISDSEKLAFFQTLAENHGGQNCTVTENESLLEGECLGYATSIIRA